MLKRAQRLASFQASTPESADSKKPRASTPESADSKKPRIKSSAFSLKRSPLTRLLCWRVGRGQSAGMMQQIANAAVLEAGVKHVSPSILPISAFLSVELATYNPMVGTAVFEGLILLF